MSTPANQPPKLVLLHGWGQSPQIWCQQIHYFSPLTNTATLQLPGHAGSPDAEAPFWLEYIYNNILQQADGEDFVLVAWSLGGQIALSLARSLQQLPNFKGWVLVSTTPCFRQQPDWSFGCADDIWQGFSHAASTGDTKVMQRFFRLMLHGDNIDRQAFNHFAHIAINKLTRPTLAGLKAGLDLLSSLDERANLSDVLCPTLIFHGNNDAIVPVSAGRYLAKQISNAKYHEFEECGHAPFLTHDTAFNQTLELWWKNLSA